MDAVMFLSLVLLLASSWYLSISISRAFFAERMLVGYSFLMLQVLLAGYSASALQQFGNSNYWLATSVVLTLLVCLIGWGRTSLNSAVGKPEADMVAVELDTDHAEVSRHLPVVIVLGITVALVVVANLLTAVLTAPHNIDSHTCHLARTAHFVQQGSLNWYPTNMWAQVSHPRNHPILLAFALKLGGENATQLVNLSAWLLSAVCIWGIVFNLQRSVLIAWISSLLSLLFVNGMLMATTTQNDLIVASQSGTTIYLLSAWYRTGARRYLFLLGMPLFICFGVKASVALYLPAFSLIALTIILGRRVQLKEPIFAPIAIVAASTLAAGIAATPTGYVQNIFRYGHPLGVEHVRTGHTLEGLTPKEQLVESGKNTLRYMIDSTSFEGVKQGSKIDKWREEAVAALGNSLKGFGCDLQRNDHSKREFFLSRPYRNHEDYSWWGIASPLLIWPSIVFSICTLRKDKLAFAFAIAFVVFLLCQGYAQYDPWRGRYFTWATPMVMVPVAFMIASLLKNRGGQTFLMLAVIAVCLTSGRALLYRTNSFLIRKNDQQSIFEMDRFEQLARNTPEMAMVIKNFQREVSDAAKVAIALSGNHQVYPFYGARWQHEVSYTLPNTKSIGEASGTYDFLVYSDKGNKVIPVADDLLLGSIPNLGKIYLRAGDKQKADNCFE